MSKTHIFLVGAFLLSACNSSEPAPTASAPAPASAAPSAAAAPKKEDVALASAKAAAGKLGTAVKTKLVDAMNTGGAPNAVEVCSVEAYAIAEGVGRESGARVGRSSSKLRNPKDAGPPWVSAWLAAQAGKQAEQTVGIEGVYDSPEGRVARYLKPIGIEALCLSCHGDKAQLAEPVRAALAAKYPADEATGYRIGDLRGALWAEVPVAP
jgi:hypothetical protein